MLGAPVHAVAAWGAGCHSTRWLTLLQRVRGGRARTASSSVVAAGTCAVCSHSLAQVLIFKCSKCSDVFFCEKCYLYDKDLAIVPGHKKTHVIYEVVNEEEKPTEPISFIKSIKRFFFCTKTKKKKTSKTSKHNYKQGTARQRKHTKQTIFTSTVGKASGTNANNPATTLQDIITQLESQNMALRELSEQLQGATKDSDTGLKEKVDAHYSQISTQIHRLKELKDNINENLENLPPSSKFEKGDRPQAFDLFSPIPFEDQQPKAIDMKNQPRILSMDSGNFSVTTKQNGSQNLLTVSGDALKPIVIHSTSDTISTVSMNDMTNWYNDTEQSVVRRNNTKIKMDCTAQSLSATEQKYAADIRSVEDSNDKMKELNADLDTVLDRLQQILTNNFAMDDSCFDNSQLRETAHEMEGLLGSLIRGVEQRATLGAAK